jgi:hypothetical protein
MHNIQNLLNQVGIIVKKNNEILDAIGGRFNVFNIIGLASDEVRLHSALLAELLRPNGSHGLKYEFLKDFIEQLNIKDFDYKTATVKVELVIGNVTDIEGGRIDIVLVDKNGFAIIIENKIYAGDQNAQLIRYNNYAKANHYGKYKILYLTLDGHIADKKSTGNTIEYTPISYAKDILNWLEVCLSRAVRLPIIRETISQYITLIKQLTNQDMNTINKDEVVNTILSNTANIDSAFYIAANISALKDRIISDYFNIQLNEIANELLIESTPLKSRVRYAGFQFIIPSWRYFDIYFEFDGGELCQLCYFYRLKDQSNLPPIATIEKLYPLFKSHNSNKSIPCGWSNMTNYFNFDVNAFKAILAGEMKSEIKNVVSNLLDLSKGLEM